MAALDLRDLNMQLRSEPNSIQAQDLVIDRENKIGLGGYSTVFKGKFGAIDVAVKEFSSEFLTKERRLIEEEARRHHAFRHPNIVFLYGIYQGPDQYFLVMALVSCSLEGLLASDAELFLEDKRIIAQGILQGLGYLHANGVVHRDLKSANVLIDLSKGLHPYLCDFGLSHLVEKFDIDDLAGKSRTKKTVIGSPSWMAPELFMFHPAIFASDFFSFAVVVWELFSRQLPFLTVENRDIIAQVLNEKKRETIPPNTPLVWVNMIEGCWQDNPYERPQEASSIIRALKFFKARDTSCTSLALRPPHDLTIAEQDLLLDSKAWREPPLRDIGLQEPPPSSRRARLLNFGMHKLKNQHQMSAFVGAANAGNSDAMYNLGILYEKGYTPNGLPNLDIALAWYTKAWQANPDDEMAAQKIKLLKDWEESMAEQESIFGI